MFRENTAFAQKIIDFYTEKGVDCSVVDEHLSLLVTLSADGRTHEFRYGSRALAGSRHAKKFYQVLEREWSKLKAAAPEPAGAAGNDLRHKYRHMEEAEEEAKLSS